MLGSVGLMAMIRTLFVLGASDGARSYTRQFAPPSVDRTNLGENRVPLVSDK